MSAEATARRPGRGQRARHRRSPTTSAHTSARHRRTTHVWASPAATRSTWVPDPDGTPGEERRRPPRHCGAPRAPVVRHPPNRSWPHDGHPVPCWSAPIRAGCPS